MNKETQSPILTINQSGRPQSIVNKKKEAVAAVTQTKIIPLYDFTPYLLTGFSSTREPCQL
jgi:hypothetical protein